jgi:voltage-gated potassium channel Kch
MKISFKRFSLIKDLDPRTGHMCMVVINLLAASTLSFISANRSQASWWNVTLLGDAVIANMVLLVRTLPRLRELLPLVYKAGLLLVIPTVLLNLAHVDLLISLADPHSFNIALSRPDAIYFTVSTVSTVGYGDIHPVSDGAELWVSGQIIIGLFITIYVIGKAMTPR